MSPCTSFLIHVPGPTTGPSHIVTCDLRQSRRRALARKLPVSAKDPPSTSRLLDRFIDPKIVIGLGLAVGVLAGIRSAFRHSNGSKGPGPGSGLANSSTALSADAQKSLQEVLSHLMSGHDLDEQATAKALDSLLVAPEHTHYQAAAFLTLLKSKGETAPELAGMARAMRKRATSVHPKVAEPLVDIVGTGGDGANTVNISTAAAVLAAASGAKVAKHGNRSSTSMCGSADVLEAFGVKIDLSARGVERCIEEVGIGFMFAPVFHPAMKNMRDVRKGLKFRTAFNILGPLLNPAMSQRQVIGVYSEDIIDKMAEAVYALGTEKTWVLHCSGLDELSPIGPATVCEVTPAGVRKFQLDPATYNIPRCTVEDLRGGDAEFNATTLRAVLGGQPGAVTNAIILNAAAGLVVANLAPTMEDAVVTVTQTLMSGKVIALLDSWAKLSQKLK